MNATLESTLIAERIPVWAALSEFFLDTALDEQDYQGISAILVSSPYTVAELESILRYEVYPVLKGKLSSGADEWATFDRDWLQEKIAPRLNKWPRIPIPRPGWSMLRAHWIRVSALVHDERKSKGEQVDAPKVVRVRE